MNVRRLDSRDAGCRSRPAALARFGAPDVEAGAHAIAEDVRVRGDDAVAEGPTAHARPAALRLAAPVAGRG